MCLFFSRDLFGPLSGSEYLWPTAVDPETDASGEAGPVLRKLRQLHCRDYRIGFADPRAKAKFEWKVILQVWRTSASGPKQI
jgi:hypothetical protein